MLAITLPAAVAAEKVRKQSIQILGIGVPLRAIAFAALE